MEKIKISTVSTAALALALVLGAQTVSAASKNNTTKASVGVVALCYLDDISDPPALEVDFTFSDQSSGDGDAEVRSWSVQAIQKGTGNWKDATSVGPLRADGVVELNPDAWVDVPPIPLCGNYDPDNNLDPGAKAVNINAVVVYGSADPDCDEFDPDPELCGDRTIILNCSPNPDRDGQGGVSVADISCGE